MKTLVQARIKKNKVNSILLVLFPLVSSCIYTVLSLIFVVSIVTWHFVTFRVNILLKMTHSNTITTHQMLPPCVLSTKH